MNRLFTTLFIITLTLSLSGQEIYLQSGINISSFDYTNSTGGSLDNLYGSSHPFMEIGYHTRTGIDNLFFSAGISYKGYGARGSDILLGDSYDWNIAYIGVPLAVNYELFKKQYLFNSLSDLTLYLKASLTPEILVSGTQSINNRVYDLVGGEQFKYPYLFARGGAGAKYSLSRVTTIFCEYTGGKGFPLKIGGSGDNEILRINTHHLGFGLRFKLPSY